MPTYEYRCKECGEHLEVVQSFKDDPLTDCPACGGSLRKVFGNIGVTFKGSGFYRTDNRPGARRSDGGASSEPASASTSTESKSVSGSDASSGSSTSGSSGSSGSSSPESKAAAAAS